MAAAVQQVLGRVPGLQAVIVTDKDGVVVVQAHVKEYNPKSVPQSVLSSASAVLDQAAKLGAGSSVAALAQYGKMKVAHFESNQLIVHLVAAKEANSGFLLEMRDEVLQKLRPVMSSLPQH